MITTFFFFCKINPFFFRPLKKNKVMSYKRADMSQICLILYIVLAPSRAHNAQGTNARAHANYSNGARNFLVASK